MCHDGSGEHPEAPEPANPTASRRAFSRLLLAGTGLAALSACAPEAARPTPSAAAAASAAATSAPVTATPSATATTTAPPAASVPASPAATAPETAPPARSTVKPRHSLTDPASPWVVVNKHRPLTPAAYVPAALVQPRVRLATSGEAALLNSTTAAAAEKMFAAAAGAGVTMTLASGYRSFATQTSTYNGYVNSRGQAAADTASARPGHSEHQTGWSFDIGDGGGACSFQPCFADQPAAAWAKANGHRFGFVVRYPWMLHDITGYYYEPWHLRYVGVEAAGEMKARGITTLEQYFGLEAAPAYR
ncbi:M15 family metallopeptidase [Arthrobacter sp. Leaf69]|uniref:M15 family metallopeptidase n=1 Tax=Arthrobacter sp. Leaf69 TaxID=1736232 RepID=UPI0006F547A1|nr:M15 family metallopeptidase [Arthrobacter sp. Leaf69]KQN95034.1 peptidase M15 [Arthrobacter sp. Leaf69]